MKDKLKEFSVLAQEILNQQPTTQIVFFDLKTFEPLDVSDKLFDASCARSIANSAFEDIVEKQKPQLMKIISDAIKSEAYKGNNFCVLDFEESDQIYLATYQKVKKHLDELGYKILNIRYTKTTSKNLLLKTKICW